MLPKPAENKQVSAYFVFYIISTMQIGVGILGFERYISRDAGNDAWISIILSGVSIHVLVWIIYQILKTGQHDIFTIHRNLFGKWIGGSLNFFFVLYMIMFGIITLRSFVEVIQVWMFPDMNTWYLSMIILVIVYLAVLGGFRVIVGLSLLSILYGLPLLLLKWFPLKQAHYYYLEPIMNHSLSDLFKASKTMTLNYLGFETLFFYFPFIKEANKSQKWAHLGVVFTVCIYLFTGLVSFVYFSKEQLSHTIWPTLSLWQTVDLPFIQRFEYFGLSIWLFVILPNICMHAWAASRGLKQLFSLKQKKGLVLVLLIIFIASLFLTDRQEVDMATTIVGKIGFYVVYLYIPFIYIYQLIQSKVRKKA
ncbi:spore germination protein (amino acid permease) [Peribacillus deserti]|uniref:Spore germination protein (Amino acid permease) n=1 Tax=Peribacillus deserti TaxID=673318 RepID=A0ABS2QLV0_9BACI|nr:GerAB/ArcD/ProY family transporter [Peribacillus deserti]MBM7693940.1 spore germination protein (amino acid permease) [Peribacillus deserti]